MIDDTVTQRVTRGEALGVFLLIARRQVGVSSGKGNLRTLTISLDGKTVLETASAGLLQEVKPLGPALSIRKNQFPD